MGKLSNHWWVSPTGWIQPNQQISWINRQGVQQAQRQQRDNVDNDGKTTAKATATAAMPTTRMAATMATTTKVTWMSMAVATTTTTMMTLKTATTTMGWQGCNGANNNGTTTIWWQWAVSVVQNACEICANHPRQQSTYADSLGRSRWERGTIFGDGRTENGRGGSDWVEITSSPLNQIRINFPHTPEWQSHGILFCMCPGSKAALLAPWWACLMMMKRGLLSVSWSVFCEGGVRPI